MQKILAITLMLALLVGCSNETPQAPAETDDGGVLYDSMDVPIVQLTPTSTGPFKYFQLVASTGTGVAGNIILNGKRIHEFGEEGSQTSSNEAQELIKSGENEIILEVTFIAAETTTASFSDSVIQIDLHAMNEAGFPEDENRIISITWDPKPGQTSEILGYRFSVER